MEIKVNRSELQRAVGITRKALSKIIIQQERGHLLFSVSDGKMKVTGTNNDLKALCAIDADCVPGTRTSFTADPKILSGVLSKMDITDVVMDFDESDQSVKVFTSNGSSSFAKLQSFPASMMLTFEPNAGRVSIPISRELFSSSVKYAENYLAPQKDDARNFDIVTISKGVMYAANGSSMMGFMVSSAFKPFDDVRLRKAILPILSSVLDAVEDKTVGLIQTGGDVGIETSTGVYFSALKPAMEPPSVQTQHVKSEGPHTIVDKALLLKHLDRLVASHTGTDGAVGVQMTLSGSGDSSYIDLSLLSSKSIERIPCSRADDTGSEDVTHIMLYSVLKSVLGSFNHGDKIRLHINEQGNKFLKAYDKGDIDKENFVQVGIGGYAKKV
jgi:hypothetical protein